MQQADIFKKMYLIKMTDDNDPDNRYWNQFETLEDAVSEGGDGTEVYYAEPKLLGKFKRKAEIVKIKSRKKRKK